MSDYTIHYTHWTGQIHMPPDLPTTEEAARVYGETWLKQMPFDEETRIHLTIGYRTPDGGMAVAVVDHA